MNIFLFLSAFIVLALAIDAAPVFKPNPTLDQRFERFKVQFKKNYGDSAEELKRRQLWEANIALIEKHNKEYNEGKHTYTLGENQFSDMTPEELANFLHGHRFANPEVELDGK